MDKITINIPMNLDVSDDDLDNILVTAFEGGSNYWIDKVEIKKQADLGFNGEGRQLYNGYASHQISRGGEVWICLDNNPVGAEIKGKEYYKWVINRKKLLRAISRWFTEYYYHRQIVKHNLEMPSSFSDIDFDAGDTDIIIQLAIFNEVIYG